MGVALFPGNELLRLAALRATGLLDSPEEERYDRLTRLVRQLFNVETVMINLIDFDRQWFKSRQGVDTKETSRDLSFCSHAILDEGICEVFDTLKDKRFSDNPFVTGPPHIRFYAAAPIASKSGYKLGTLCLLGSAPRRLSAVERSALGDFAHLVEEEIQRDSIAFAAQITGSSLEAQTIIENILDGIIVVDSLGTIQSSNQAALRLFGYNRREVQQSRIQMLLPEIVLGDGSDAHSDMEDAALASNNGQTRGVRKDSSEFAAEFMFSVILQKQHKYYILLLRDISERQADEEHTRTLAFYDPLTQVPNRRLFYERLEHARLSSKRHEAHGALLFIDLDDFKTLNDELGHQAGDLVLQMAASRIKASIRNSDTVARLGGDEFVVILEDLGRDACSAASYTEATAEKILEQLNEPYSLSPVPYQGTASIGATLFFDKETPVSELIEQADTAMYQAKAAGKNRVKFFDSEMENAVLERLELEYELRAALVNSEFVVHYQAQFNAEGKAIGAEALIRWQHPVKGLLQAREFLPLALKCGVILELDRWMIDTTCRQLAAWEFNERMAHLTMAVNISAKLFQQDNFSSLICTAVDRAGANPQLLRLEVKELVPSQDPEKTLHEMAVLSAKGIGISIDDFGTGTYSLSHLDKLPVNQLKIDGAFVSPIAPGGEVPLVARTIICLGGQMGFDVVASGVETEFQRSILIEMGCQSYQGRYSCPPLPVDEFEQTLEELALREEEPTVR